MFHEMLTLIKAQISFLLLGRGARTSPNVWKMEENMFLFQDFSKIYSG